MLWGCSSGALREMGDFDRVGTPFNYMLAGWCVPPCPSCNLSLTHMDAPSPTLVANLWDVTDRDIDRLAQAVFDDLRLAPGPVAGWADAEKPTGEGMSVVRAVARAREQCKLKYLTGAAPVVYGIPFYL